MFRRPLPYAIGDQKDGEGSGKGHGGIVLGILACLRMKTWPDLLRTLAIPAGSCCACGLLAFGLEKICLPHLGAMVTVLLELVITGAVYWFLLLMLRSFRGQDLNSVPGGLKYGMEKL